MKQQKMKRRTFCQRTALGTSLLCLNSTTALTMEKNSTMALGVIGCGGRGTHDAGNLKKVSGCRIAALADPFQDRLESLQHRYEKDSPKVYQGMDSYEKLLQSDVEAVIITSPPYFHPEHFEAAVNAQKHVYLEKPVATDTAGALRVLEAGKKGEGKISTVVGFQSRYSPDLQEAVHRVHQGAIGNIACGDAFYHSGKLGPQSRPGMPEKEAYLRDWLFDQVLSGDILVEQNIHILDVCNWFLQNHPVAAYGKGGLKVRTDYGNTWDHYEILFEYPDDVRITFYSTQFLDLGWGDQGERFNGTKGIFDGRSRPVQIRGENAWKPSPEESGNAEELKMKAFYDSIVQKDYLNEIPSGVQSTLTAILGRTAAYRNQEITWDEMIQEKEKLQAKL